MTPGEQIVIDALDLHPDIPLTRQHQALANAIDKQIAEARNYVFPAPPEAENESKKPVRDDLLQPVSNNPEPWRLRLYDRADGVKGHYCVGRWNPAGYHEFWNQDQFCSAGEVIIGEHAAVAKAIEISTTPTPVPAEADLLSVLKAAANYICRAHSDYYDGETRDIIIKALTCEIDRLSENPSEII